MKRDIKILICGASGMMGSNLVEDNPGYSLLTPSSGELDLLDYNSVESYLRTKPDMIINCAGKVDGIRANINNPMKYFIENLDMGMNLLKASVKQNIKNFINISSHYIYPDIEGDLKEDMILSGKLNPSTEAYGLAKIAIYKYCEYINSFYQYNYKTIIPCVVYGKYDRFDTIETSRLIPAIFLKTAQSEMTIHGDGTERRGMLYSKDASRMIWEYVSRFEDMPPVMNLASETEYSVGECYNTIINLSNYRGDVVYDITKTAGAKRRVLDISLQKKLNLKPEYTLEQGLTETYKYYVQINEQHMG